MNGIGRFIEKLFLFLVVANSGWSEEIDGEGLSAGPEKETRIQIQSKADSYYVLYRIVGETGLLPGGLALGTGEALDLVDGMPGTGTGFYFVEEIPRTAARDSDGDGIDDVYELENTGILDPLNPSDARKDPNCDGVTFLDDYQLLQGELSSAQFEIISLQLQPDGTVIIRYSADPGHHYLLQSNEDLQTPWINVDMELGSEAEGEFIYHGNPEDDFVVFRFQIIDNADQIDTDGDGLPNLYELLNPSFLSALDPSDAALDPDGDGQSHLDDFLTAFATQTTIESSPDDGEVGVATTRETIIRFSSPVVDLSPLSDDTFYASYGGEKLPARIHQSPNRKTVTLFYDDPLPPSSLIRVYFNGDVLRDALWRQVDADGDGVPGGTAEIEFQTLSVTTLPGTAVCGRVFASEMADAASGDDFVNCPLAGVKISVDGREEELFTFTDQFGNFRLDPAPAGRFFVHIDGRSATNPGIPAGAYYPFVGKAWEAVAGKETSIGEVYLPLVIDGTLTATSAAQTTEVTFPSSVIALRPELSGVMLEVPANSIFSDDGSRGGMVGIAPVDPQRLPGTLPPGLESAVVITVQTDGATNFDQPVPICFPNLPNPVTGEILPPGAESALWSFNHDIGRFEMIGPMRVNAEGTLICSEPGVGILAPGWHCTGQGTPCEDDGDDEGPDPGPPGSDDPTCPLSSKTNPILPFSGEKVQRETDLQIRGRGMDFTWTRSYASRTGELTVQGHNWDFSYNLCLRREGRILTVMRGRSEPEKFQMNAAGDFERREFFTKITKQEDGGWLQLKADQTKLLFHSLDAGLPHGGKIQSITDRNGNQMLFQYDPQGRLAVITDTLGRDINLAYNAEGFIESVTDFTGREVRYTYYTGEAGGSPGDLKSVRSPVVVGTPNGNDFPNGKLRSYTYTSGFAEEELNHNLISITDGRRNDATDPNFGSGAYLVNTYSDSTDSTDSTDVVFDRAVRQVLGGDVVDFHYERLTPEDPGRDAVLLVIINDRNGNVQESFYDAGNRLLRERDYTGRANPAQPTTLTANRPAGKLRASDPAFFETTWSYNEDSLVKEITKPNGNIETFVYESDISPTLDARARGNLRFKTRSPGSHLPAGDQEEIVEAFEYATDFACPGCGFNFVTRHVDGRGNETISEFDSKGNLTKRTHRIASIVEDFEYNLFGQMTARVHPDNGSGHRRRDEFTYHAAGPQMGYQASQIVDATGFVYTTSYEYDARGNATRVVDPRGFDQLSTYNALDQVVQEFSAEVTNGSGLRYEKRSWFDANNNVTRQDVKNRDGDGVVVAANPWFTTSYEFEILNNVVRSTQEVDAGRSVVTEYAYDGNRNRSLTRYGEATNGNQPENTVTTIFDERDLVLDRIQAAGHADQSTTRSDYDGNKNLVASRQGTEDAVAPRVTSFTYDGFDRRLSKTDPMGSVCQYSYDENSNQTRELCLGEFEDKVGSAGNVRLREMSYAYDIMDRRTTATQEHFKHDAGNVELAIGDGQSVTQTTWSDFSQMLTTTNDNNHTTTYTYDTVNRVGTVTDAKSNAVTYSYDSNSNRVSQLETDKSDLGNADQLFTTAFTYDGLNRLGATTDNVGNANQNIYDSRSNRVKSVDALGNVIHFIFDGLNRLTSTVRIMTDTGDGTGTEVDQIITGQGWDDTSRLVSQTDDNGNVTTYLFDGLNRKTGEVYADATSHVHVLDVHGNKLTSTDGNANVVTSQHDLNNRLVRRDVVVGPGVSDDTTFEIYKYDGISRLTRAEDDDSVVTRLYDSLSHQVSETLNGQTTACVYDGVGNQTQCSYPGGRVISTTFDPLERKSVISDGGGMIATYDYIGSTRVERRDYGNGTRTDYTYDGITGVANPANDFGVKKIIRTSNTKISDGTVIDDRSYTWDRLRNKTQRKDLRVGGPQLTHDYGYDSAYRMVQSMKSDLGGVLDTIDYSLDGVGNRTSVAGGDDPGVYTLDATAPDPADRQMNQYTATSFDARSHDQNGNLTTINSGLPTEREFVFDYRNRLVEYAATSSGIDSKYAYDALDRRLQKLVGSDKTNYVYEEWQVIEEQNEVSTTDVSYCYGNYIDEVLQVTRAGTKFYCFNDDLFSIVSTVDSGGAVAERYGYSDFGVRTVFDASGLPIGSSSEKNPNGMTGRRLDEESGLYYYRTRYMLPDEGQFLTRDTIGIWGDFSNIGNPRTYVRNNPLSASDPYGTYSLPNIPLGVTFSGSCCVPLGFGFGFFQVCASGSGTAITGECCKDNEIARYTEFSASVSLYAKVGTPGRLCNWGISIPLHQNRKACPQPGESNSFGGFISAQSGNYYSTWDLATGVVVSGWTPSFSWEIQVGGYLSKSYTSIY